MVSVIYNYGDNYSFMLSVIILSLAMLIVLFTLVTTKSENFSRNDETKLLTNIVPINIKQSRTLLSNTFNALFESSEFVNDSILHPSLIIEVKASIYHTYESPKGIQEGRPANIRLWWKWLALTNSLTYFIMASLFLQ